jgi:hypothetical protein
VAGGGTCDDVELLCGFHIITPGPGQFPRLWKEAHRSMNTRRDFLSVAFKGSAMAAATAFLSDSDPALAGSGSGRSANRMEDTINNGSTCHGGETMSIIFRSRSSRRQTLNEFQLRDLAHRTLWP